MLAVITHHAKTAIGALPSATRVYVVTRKGYVRARSERDNSIVQNFLQSPGGPEATNHVPPGDPTTKAEPIVSPTTIRHSGVPENTHSAASATVTATWRIGEKPHDPLDPGPYGTPGWQPDPRRGRRRRGELPDPLPTEQQRPRPTKPSGAPPGSERRFEPPGSQHHAGPPGDEYSGSGRARRAGERERPSPLRSEAPEPQRFSPMREAAYHAFLRDSAELHMAHLERPEPNRVLIYLRWYLQIVLAILYWQVLPFPDPPSRCRRVRAACEARHANRHIGRAPVARRIASAPSPAETERLESAETASPVVSAEPPNAAAPPPADLRALAEPPAIPVEWRTVASPPSRPAPARPATPPPAREPDPFAERTGARPAPVPRHDPPSELPFPLADPPRSRRPVRPHPALTPRNAAHSRRRAETRRIFLHTYGMTRDQNHRNLNWPKGSWAGFDCSDTYPTNPRRGAIKRRRNHRPRNLALARSFPSTTPAVLIGATSRPAPVGPAARLLLLPAPYLPGETRGRAPYLADEALRRAIAATARRFPGRHTVTAARSVPPMQPGRTTRLMPTGGAR